MSQRPFQHGEVVAVQMQHPFTGDRFVHVGRVALVKEHSIEIEWEKTGIVDEMSLVNAHLCCWRAQIEWTDRKLEALFTSDVRYSAHLDKRSPNFRVKKGSRK